MYSYSLTETVEWTNSECVVAVGDSEVTPVANFFSLVRLDNITHVQIRVDLYSART